MDDLETRAALTLRNALVLLHAWQGVREYTLGGDDDDTDGDGIDGIDCSAFAERCAGRRKYDGRLWWNSDRIYADARIAHRRWEQIAAPIAGCIGVYPGRSVLGKRTPGHVFVVHNVRCCATIEASGMAQTVTVLRRPAWFAPGAKGNGQPIVWAVAVDPRPVDPPHPQ